MPQLDALTYFSQYIYLVLTFVGVYIFVLQFIMPQVLSAFKLRQKLNSLHLLSTKLEAPSLKYQDTCLEKLNTNYDTLTSNLWNLGSSKQSHTKITSARTMQFCNTWTLKKMGLKNILRVIYRS